MFAKIRTGEFLVKFLFFIASIELAAAQSNPIWDVYQNCKNSRFASNFTHVCDPNNFLANLTKSHVNQLLWDLQTETPCYCEKFEQCQVDPNFPVSISFKGLLIVTDKIEQRSDPLL